MKLFILFIGAGLIAIFSTLSGGGASLLLMPLIAYTAGVRYVAPIMTLGIAMSSSSRVFYFWKDIDWQLFRWLFPSTIAGSILGARLFAELSTDMLQILIGLLLVSTGFQLFGKKKENKKPRFTIKVWHFVPIGFIISFLSGLIGGVGPLMNSAYLGYGMKKESLIGTRSANAVLLHISKICSYAWFGFINSEVLKYGLIIGVASILCNYIGKNLLNKITEHSFRKFVVFTMIISGVLMLFKHSDLINDFIKNYLQ
ncbi:MAG: sulfite exporter TauE/SafE family protein [Cyclobacteriaceae bacterium]|nr:sulfite exporter TauE/SafE family protein [Cyclobacteriaceae bacterium]